MSLRRQNRHVCQNQKVWSTYLPVIWFNVFVEKHYQCWTSVRGRQDQAISGENFSQSEYVAFGAISQFAFPPLTKAIHRAFHYVYLSNLCSKQAFHSINLSNVGFIIESQSVRIHLSFRQKPINKLRFEAENSTDPYPFASINWDPLDYNLNDFYPTPKCFASLKVSKTTETIQKCF